MEDCTIAETFLPKGTMLAANLLHAHASPEAWGNDAGSFDPYRFLRLEEENGKRFGIVTTTPNILNFGHGRHACPGRFFAAQQMKLILAYLLVKFDMKIDTPGGRRPKDFWFGLACMPDPRSRILIRRRTGYT
jgi:cytochrome P450